MKKKMITILLAMALLIPMSGVAANTDRQVSAADIVAMDYRQGNAPAETNYAESMYAPVNALVMCMIERDVRYDENDPVFFWNSLYYMLSLYGQMDDRAELTDDTLMLPRETIEDYAAALFHSYNGLLPLPTEIADQITYNANTGMYSLARGDAGLSEIRFDGCGRTDDMLTINGSLINLEDGSVQRTFRVELVANESMFGYAICGLDIL